jgi:oligosaccharide repeat unit polymerase
MKGLATIVIIYGALAVYLLLPDTNAAEIFSAGAWGMAIVLAVALLIESLNGWHRLLRLDIALFGFLYGLTFAEFLLPNPVLMLATFGASARDAAGMTLVGFAGLAVGRHLVPETTSTRPQWHLPELGPKPLFLLLSGCFFVGIAHVLIATRFDIGLIITSLGLNRWSRPWTRGQYGGAYAMIYEMRLVLNLIPPLTGMILSRRRMYGAGVTLAALLYLAVTLIYGFSEGTRSVLVIYVFLFVAGYLLTRPRVRAVEVLVVMAIAGLVITWASIEMLRFRDSGWTSYAANGVVRNEGTMVDNNLFAISGLIEAFPDRYPFLGPELVIHGLTLPIPRVLWPGKPTGLSVEANEALGLRGLSVASTFIGEGWMSGGVAGVVIFSLAFGAFGAWWNRFGSNRVSNLDKVFYATGYIAAGVGCRSVLFVFTALLPSLALWLAGRFLANRVAPRQVPARRFARRPG